MGAKVRDFFFFACYPNGYKEITGYVDMDVVSKLLTTIDAFRAQFSSWNKRNAEDYYELVAPVDHEVAKMNNSTMVTFFELAGINSMLTEKEKIAVAQKISRDISGFIKKKGYELQIVDLSDKAMSDELLRKSTAPSFAELHAQGLGHPVLTTDYLQFLQKNLLWKKQYLVVYTTRDVLTKSDFKNMQPEEDLASANAYIQEQLQVDINKQACILTQVDKAVLGLHLKFVKGIRNRLGENGILLRTIDIESGLRTQKEALYGETFASWKPAMSIAKIKTPETVDKGRYVDEAPSMASQILYRGGTEVGLPPGVFQFGDRFFSTLSMVCPQQDGERMASYSELTKLIPLKIGYMCAFRLQADPFSTNQYRVEQGYAGASAVLPFTNNLQIRRSRSELESRHKNGDSVVVYMQMTLTFVGNTLQEVLDNLAEVVRMLDGWNQAKFRLVEQDKFQGLFESIPGASRKANLKMVMENLADALYQTPLFLSGVPNSSGYLHFGTEDMSPYPMLRFAASDINYNGYICGTAGSGKSTLLAALNLALLAKPKVNENMSGMLPLLVDVDFNKTSFGMKRLLQQIAPESKKHLFLMHEMSVAADSAINAHDLPLGRSSPTMRYKSLLVRFLTVLIGEVHKDDDGGIQIAMPAIEKMISYMVQAVYDYRQNGESPRMFLMGEFQKEKATLVYMQKLGINPVGQELSYWELRDEVMQKGAKDLSKAAVHASILQRYAVPRLTDYATLLSDRQELAQRFSSPIGGANGQMTEAQFFNKRLAEVLNEFPCLGRPTAVGLDVARLISIDIAGICGENDFRKAVFGSLCLAAFVNKRENSKESPDLLDGMPAEFHAYWGRMNKINQTLPAALNIEEAHMLFPLFGELLVSLSRHNRKAGWGLCTLSQNLLDPSVDLMSVSSNVILASNENSEKAQLRLRESFNASQAECKIAGSELVERHIYLNVKKKPASGLDFAVTRVGVKLKSLMSPGILWATNSEQVDIDFRDDAVESFGHEGLTKLTTFFPSGSVRGYYENDRILKLATERGFPSVRAMLLSEFLKLEHPSPELARWL